MDDLIENLNKENDKLFRIGQLQVELLNEERKHKKLLNICKLIKGYEIGSNNYIEVQINDEMIQYIRVGDLSAKGNTYTKYFNELVLCSSEDILIAFDGAPGRNAIGLKGAISSGIYKVECEPKYKGLIYFEINSKLNQGIIKDNSQGTTILHASKSIQFLEAIDIKNNECILLNYLFDQLVNNKAKIDSLLKIKQLLLAKYF